MTPVTESLFALTCRNSNRVKQQDKEAAVAMRFGHAKINTHGDDAYWFTDGYFAQYGIEHKAPGTVTVPQPENCMDKQDGFTYSEQYRHECEVRYLVRWFPDFGRIKVFLDGVRKVRGEEAYEKLRNDLLVKWKERR